MKKEYVKGDKVTIQGEAVTMYGISYMVSVQDDDTLETVDDVLQDYDGRKFKVTIEFLD